MYELILNHTTRILFDTRADAVRAASYIITLSHGGSCIIRRCAHGKD